MHIRRLLSVLCMLLFVGISGCSNGPGTQVKAYIAALDNGDSDAAAKMFSSRVRKSTGAKLTMVIAQFSDEFKKAGGVKSVVVLSETVRGDTAQVRAVLTMGSGKVDTLSTTLLREDGAWKMNK